MNENKAAVDTPQVDLRGKFCPFAVVCVIKEVDSMPNGQSRMFLVDDPLAIKSVPEELADYEGIACNISKIEKGWAITIDKK